MQMKRMRRMQPGMTRGRGACVDVGDEGPVCAARTVRRIESIRGAVDRVENAENSLTSKRMWLALDARMGGPVRAPSLKSDVSVSLGHLEREEGTACVVHRAAAAGLGARNRVNQCASGCLAAGANASAGGALRL